MKHLILIVVLASCGSAATATDAAVDNDAVRLTDATEPTTDAGPFEPGPEPTMALRPKPGELTFIQLELPPGLTQRLGEASIIVGPDGSLLLLDIGNSTHDDEVRDAVRELNTQWLTPEYGFPARDPLQVEWVIITHFHGDHLGAFQDLFVDDALTGLKGIVHRGFVDLGDGMNTTDFEQFCSAMTTTYAGVDRSLCVAASVAGCDFSALASPHPATDCPTLLRGDLATTTDDAEPTPAYIDLDGAIVTFVGANGYFGTGDDLAAIASFGHETGDEENARSVAGVIRYGDFRYHFGGDLHGRASDGPDVESHLVATSGPAFYGDLGVDVIHAHHHARGSSSNATFVEAMAPVDGLARNVIAGINERHLGSPFQETLDAWSSSNRLGEGKIWITTNTVGGGTSPALIEAKGSLIIQTIQEGRGYWMQAVGASVTSRAYESVR